MHNKGLTRILLVNNTHPPDTKTISISWNPKNHAIFRKKEEATPAAIIGVTAKIETGTY